MGNFEKLVVLTVLFLAATILGITMHGDGEARSDDPLGSGADGTGSGTLSSLVVEEQPAVKERAKPVVQPTPEVLKPAPVRPEPDVEVAQAPPVKSQPAPQPVLVETEGKTSILRSTEGLVEAFQGADVLSYEWKAGDTQSDLAQRFYGDPKMRNHLRAANEGHQQPKPGETIWVPRYDELSEAGSRPVKTAAPEHEITLEPSAPSAAAQTYVVVEGDSLWSIAVDAYGKGIRWSDIYKANRHQMKSENDLQIGMKLIIP